MADLTLRNVKGSPLTNQEVDDNFSNLNTDKWSQDNTKISNWDTAYSWGDHAAVGYLTTLDGDGSDLLNVRAETVEVVLKNVSGSTIPKGTPVHQTGTAGAATFEVVPADASNASVMPAHFIAGEELADEEEGRGILVGRISSVDTSAFAEGDTIYVAPGGGYTNTAPTGEGNLIQNLGTVTRVDATNGGGEVYGAGRTAATPNLNQGNIFIGDATNRAVTAALSTSVEALASYNNANWDTAYGWGDHAAVGYLTSFTETDPTVPAHVKSITTTEKTNWNTAYSWGNHASVGYLTSASLTGYATETYVNTAVSNLVDSAPGTLDTLNELAAALGDDPNFATTVSTQLGNKVDKVAGKGLSTEDYTTAEKNKLAGIAAGAQVNVGTNLGSSGTGATRTITSSTGGNTSITYSAADVGALPAGGKAASLNVPDTRAANDQPQNKLSKAISADFKANTSVSNPPVNASDTYSHIITVAGWNTDEGSGGWPTQLSVGTGGIAYRQASSATVWGGWSKMFHDGYHPNADTWTTARTITLGGDLSGSVSINGGSNVTLSAQVANDSHTHDGRYYTESESDARFVNTAGDTLTGTLNYRMLSDQSTSNLDTCGDSSGFSTFYSTTSAVNKPSGTDHSVLTLSYSSDWQTQLAGDWRTKQLYYRTQENGTWKTWATIWHSDNFATGSDTRNFGSIQIGGTTVIGASRNLANLSGDIRSPNTFSFLTPSSNAQYGKFFGVSVSSTYSIGSYGGYFNAQNGYMVGNTTIIDASRNLTNIGTLNGGTPWHSGNDGSGSGLDADLLDGRHEGGFVLTSGGVSGNLDPEYRAGMFSWSTGATSRPSSGFGQGLIIVSNGASHNNINNWITQLGFGTDTNTAYFRGKTNSGGWGSWHTLFHTGNDGSGSGLDADLLDGLNSSEFARSRGRSNWNDGTVINNVVGMLAWKNYSNNHVIFDASNSTSPSGSAVNNTNAQVPWTGTYPTLMGWNGASTYGVRVDSARVADSAGSATTATTATNSTQLGGITSNRALLKRRTRIHTSDGTSLNSSISAPEMGFTYGGSGEPTGPFIAFGGLGGNIDYSCQLVGAYSGGGNDFKIRTRNDDAATWNAWRTILTDGNYNSYSPTLTGGGASGTWGISVAGNSATTSQRSFSGTLTGQGDVRAPIFYDSANTAYFVDPASTSVLNNARIAGVIYVGNGTTSHQYLSFLNASAAAGIKVGGLLCSDAYNFGTPSRNDILAKGNITAYSDGRYKTNIEVIDNAVHKVKQIRGVTYDMTDDSEGRRYAGVIAQEVKEVLPEVVLGSEEDRYSVAYGNMVGLLIEAIKEQQTQIEALTSEINTLKEMIK